MFTNFSELPEDAKRKWIEAFDELEKRVDHLEHESNMGQIGGDFMSNDKWMTDLSIEELKTKILPKPSNLGRVRYDGKVLWQVGDIENPSPYGYLLVKIQEKSHRVYTLVAETWCERGEPAIYDTVHHLSNNGMDNRASNLVWVTPEQHAEIHPFLKNLKK